MTDVQLRHAERELHGDDPVALAALRRGWLRHGLGWSGEHIFSPHITPARRSLFYVLRLPRRRDKDVVLACVYVRPFGRGEHGYYLTRLPRPFIDTPEVLGWNKKLVPWWVERFDEYLTRHKLRFPTEDEYRLLGKAHSTQPKNPRFDYPYVVIRENQVRLPKVELYVASVEFFEKTHRFTYA